MRTLLPLLAFGAGCTEQSFSQINDALDAESGTISGRVCDLTTQQWIGDALVYTHLYDDTGKLYDTRSAYTAPDGRWTLGDLPGLRTYLVYIQVGNDLVEQFEVKLDEQADIVLEEPACYEEGDLSVAVVSGDYDELSDFAAALGFTNVHVVNGQTGSAIIDFLTRPEELAEHDILFLDGGHLEADVLYSTHAGSVDTVQAVQAGLRTFVEGGGTLMASDWSYDAVEVLWPDAIDFHGDDATPDAAQVGEPGAVSATLSDAGAIAAVGGPGLSVSYDLPIFPVMESAGAGTTVYATGHVLWRAGTEVYTAVDAPLMAGFYAGNGRVVLTTWRNESNAEASHVALLRYALGL